MDTKKGCDQITRQLRLDGWPALSIDGDKSQAERDWFLSEFKSGKSPLMTATDVAARSLDVKDVKYVINYDFPGSLEDYVHRIGRMGRAGAKGTAYSFFTAANARFANDLIKILEAGQKVSPEIAKLGPGAPHLQVSYAEALKPVLPWAAEKSFDGVGEDYKRATVYNNKPAIFYTEEEVSGMSNAFRFALIGKFLESRSNQMTIIQSFANLWLSSFYNIRFMRIFKWSPKFPYEAESSVIPVWIQLPDLPIHMFCKKGLFAAANIVGRPLKVDQATADDSRLTMARVCVEIDLLKPKIEDFSIGHSVEECYGNGYHPNPAWGVGKQSSAIVGEDPRDLKEDKHLEGIPKECVEAHPGDSELPSLGLWRVLLLKTLSRMEENVLDLHNLDIRDREEELIVNQKMVHEEVGVHVSYGTKPYRGEGVAVAEISKNTRSDASSEEEDVGGSSVLNDESSGGAVRQRPDWDPGILKMMNNFMHLKISSQLLPSSIFISERYAKCNSGEMRILWERLLDVKPIDDVCWLVGGDFNVISSIDEQFKGVLLRPGAIKEFNDFLMLSGLSDHGFVGDKFTWTNKRIWKRLDRILISPSWNDKDLVIKLKGLDHLKWWNEVVFGNIHDKVKLEEERYAAVEKKFGADPSVVNRIQMGESQASLFKTLHMEEMFWKQKAATKWIGEGDRNTKLFHNLVQKRRVCGGNLILKLDMAKAYDRVQWVFLLNVMKAFRNEEISIPSAIVLLPPLCALHQLEMIFAYFFWGSTELKKSIHWIAWKDVCKPVLEGDLGVGKLLDVACALEALLEVEVVAEVIGTALLPDEVDKLMWKPAGDGKFSLKSTWNQVRQKYHAGGIWVAIWSRMLSPTIAVFVWRTASSVTVKKVLPPEPKKAKVDEVKVA
ncbi:hypothetical protein ZIOFF_041490 [Zingiber officinale]|uniref:Helicase C-terminal domain-containing protein n=1 Tax=Zingiber officinale TaxID=94328 RepID=A0A8J5GDT4_ZINOF|nr:hypothetical protein ZIOFF_041490 [Zingiber officinale]